MILRDGKFIEAYYQDKNRTVIQALWHNMITDQVSSVIVNKDMSETLYQQVIDTFSLDQIEKMTQSKKARTRNAVQALVANAIDNSNLADENIFNIRDIVSNNKTVLEPIKKYLLSVPIINADKEAIEQIQNTKTALEAFAVASKYIVD